MLKKKKPLASKKTFFQILINVHWYASFNLIPHLQQTGTNY